jgi:hypothetical protein
MMFALSILARMGRNALSVRSNPFGGFIPELLSDTDVDISTRLISLEDDPSLPAFTFRMWLLGLGLSCFGSVLGQIFVSLRYPLSPNTSVKLGIYS